MPGGGRQPQRGPPVALAPGGIRPGLRGAPTEGKWGVSLLAPLLLSRVSACLSVCLDDDRGLSWACPPLTDTPFGHTLLLAREKWNVLLQNSKAGGTDAGGRGCARAGPVPGAHASFLL